MIQFSHSSWLSYQSYQRAFNAIISLFYRQPMDAHFYYFEVEKTNNNWMIITIIEMTIHLYQLLLSKSDIKSLIDHSKLLEIFPCFSFDEIFQTFLITLLKCWFSSIVHGSQSKGFVVPEIVGKMKHNEWIYFHQRVIQDTISQINIYIFN